MNNHEFREGGEGQATANELRKAWRYMVNCVWEMEERERGGLLGFIYDLPLSFFLAFC